MNPFDSYLDNAHETYYNYNGGEFHIEGFEDVHGMADVAYPASGDFMATGAGQAPTSQPYIINIQNTTGENVSDVVVLDAYNALLSSTTNFGNPASIVLTSGIPNVTYSEFLEQTKVKPFLVGLTYLSSSNTNQPQQVITVRHQDANGNLADSPIVPTTDPYQFQSGTIPVYFNYRVDGYSSLTVATIFANTTLTLRLYPKTKVDIGLGAVGQNVDRTYSSPGVVRPRPQVVMNPGSRQALPSGRGYSPIG